MAHAPAFAAALLGRQIIATIPIDRHVLLVAEVPVGADSELEGMTVADLQRLVTEVRRFRSDQGLADRQKVPARLGDIAAADLDSQTPAVTSLAWRSSAASSPSTA